MFLQATTRCLFPFFASSNVSESIVYLDNVYKNNLNTDENWFIFKKFMRILQKCVNIIFGNYATLLVMFHISPIVVFISTESLFEPIYACYIPGTEQYPYLNYSEQFVRLFAMVAVYLFYDALFLFEILHVTLMANILQNKICAINRMAMEKLPSKYEMIVNLRNVILLHHDLLG